MTLPRRWWIEAVGLMALALWALWPQPLLMPPHSFSCGGTATIVGDIDADQVPAPDQAAAELAALLSVPYDRAVPRALVTFSHQPGRRRLPGEFLIIADQPGHLHVTYPVLQRRTLIWNGGFQRPVFTYTASPDDDRRNAAAHAVVMRYLGGLVR